MFNKKITNGLLFWGKISLIICLTVMTFETAFADCDPSKSSCANLENPEVEILATPSTPEPEKIYTSIDEGNASYDTNTASKPASTPKKAPASPPAQSQSSSTPSPTTPEPSTPDTSSAGDTYSQFKVGDYLTIKDEKTQASSDNSTTSNVGLQGTQQQAYLKSQNPVGAFILQIINLIALTAASLSFLAVVVAGFMMMSAAGNENQLNKGKEILTKAIVGLVITLSAYFIVAFVQNLLFETVSQ